MISLRKLASLKEGTRLRKIAWVCRYISEDLLQGASPDPIYLRGLGQLIAEQELPEQIIGVGVRLSGPDSLLPAADLARSLDNLHFILSRHLGATPGDWDLKSGAGLDEESRIVRPFRVYLDDIRSPFNVGSIFRTSEALGVERIYLSPATPDPEHPRARRTAMGCDEVIPWEHRSLDELESEPAVFALELGGSDIDDFDFPESGTVILGSEELGISTVAQRLVDRKNGRVSIPMLGSKGSVNVGVAFGILMYAWNKKRH